MSEWKRATRQVSFEQMPANMKTAVQKHLELYNLGNILSDAVLGIQTDSEKAKQGLLSAAETVQMAAWVTPHWLVWVVSGTKTPITVLSALLSDVVVEDYAATPFAKMVPDSGIQVSGKFTDVTENTSAFIGLENNEAGERFKETVIRAVQESKK